ncbi:MAG: hypothetical protein LCH63_09265 [Candidatus Melainabacteria bacterium]|nr:hypothetical protein [Candidatus Melainabacteria bacterium]
MTWKESRVRDHSPVDNFETHRSDLPPVVDMADRNVNCQRDRACNNGNDRNRDVELYSRSSDGRPIIIHAQNVYLGGEQGYMGRGPNCFAANEAAFASQERAYLRSMQQRQFEREYGNYVEPRGCFNTGRCDDGRRYRPVYGDRDDTYYSGDYGHGRRSNGFRDFMNDYVAPVLRAGIGVAAIKNLWDGRGAAIFNPGGWGNTWNSGWGNNGWDNGWGNNGWGNTWNSGWNNGYYNQDNGYYQQNNWWNRPQYRPVQNWRGGNRNNISIFANLGF